MTPFAPPSPPALFTDLYILTMAQSYYQSGQGERHAHFDYFFRTLPFEGGYAVFSGLGDFLALLDRLEFDQESLEFLHGKGFDPGFLDHLAGWRFSGSIRAMREGEVIFPLEPVVQVSGTIFDTQLLESLLLNTLNFSCLISTKAARIAQAAGGRAFMEFGMRRAQGLGALMASKAACIGGAAGTSNVLASALYGLNLRGTMAHNWVQMHQSERQAFETWAALHPQDCVLLVDTYNTLASGVPHAIEVAKTLKAQGHDLRAIRLDSGDLAYLSKRARKMLDDAGFASVQIYATNQLDEHLIKSLLDQGAPIDLFGVGTRLVTGHPASALDGVYKLAMRQEEPCIKVSDNFTKVNFPGRKDVWRFLDDQGHFYGDGIVQQGERATEIHHPFYPGQSSKVGHLESEPLLHQVITDGTLVAPSPDASEAASWATQRLDRLPEEHRRFTNPHPYKVGASESLLKLRASLYEAATKNLSKD